jgi:hypothetical protein
LTIDNLQTIGRNGMHRYNNMDHSMLTGMLAVQNALGANHDLWEANEEEGYLEEDKEAKAGQLIPGKVLVQTFARLDKLAFGIAVGSVAGLLVFLARRRCELQPQPARAVFSGLHGDGQRGFHRIGLCFSLGLLVWVAICISSKPLPRPLRLSREKESRVALTQGLS